MPSALNPEKLIEHLSPIISTCTLWAKKNLTVLIIANPIAASFTIAKQSTKDNTIFQLVAHQAKKQNSCVTISSISLYKTICPGDAKKKARSFIHTILNTPTNTDEYLLISAGGDGTSLEIQTALAQLAFTNEKAFSLITQKISILRLPLGTGNDGTDGKTVGEALCRITKPAHFLLQPAIKIQDTVRTTTTKQQGKKIHLYESLSKNSPWYAFNIASIGIDAFISHMTNKTKDIFPGNFYKLWINLSCLFYDFKFPAKPVDIEVFNKNGKSILHTKEAISFCVFGTSGHRTYGSGQKILPDNRTICIAKKMNIPTKLAMKKKVSMGQHTQSDKVLFADGEKIIINYNQYILSQMDGEVHLLCPEQFPITMERTLPVIRIIKNDTTTYPL